MLYNHALYKKYDVENEGDLSGFTDADKVSDWAERLSLGPTLTA